MWGRFWRYDWKRFSARAPVYQPGRIDETLAVIERCLQKELKKHYEEKGLKDAETWVTQAIEAIRIRGPFRLSHNADFTLARFCYLICRALKPRIVLETGVAYGVTSAFILQALECNGNGVLQSVDLPPLGKDTDKFVGILVPRELRHRWRLHRGASKRVLPSLLPELGQVDIFIHDSLHTYWNMKREFEQVKPYLARPSVVIADDVQGNPAFLEWVEEAKPACWGVTAESEKNALFGVSVFV